MEPLVQVKKVGKAFSGVPALSDISVDFYPGRVHVLLGENGAGKSTLIKIISGVYHRDQGTVWLDGREIAPQTPREGIDLGISVIHQELSVVQDLTVAENIYLDRLPSRGGFVEFGRLYRESRELMERLGITNIDPRAKVRALSVAEQQMVEILRAVSRSARLVIMDEPTSSLSEREVEALFSVIQTLKREQVAIVYISHKLKEITAVGDDISIFKDGELVCTRLVSELSESDMVRLMVGREIGDYYIRAPGPGDSETVLEVKGLSGTGYRGVSFRLHRGEVLGVAGLVGSGRTEVMRAIFGADRYDSGEVLVNGRKRVIRHPKEAIAAGIGLVPEDRRRQGVLLDASVRHNISLVSLCMNSRHALIDFEWERSTAAAYIKKLRVKTPGMAAMARSLSGGNQQKIVLAKWLAAKADILILDEPTRGIDVNAKGEIYRLIRDFVQQGGSVILVSSELPEVIGVSHRVLVMHNGRVTGTVRGEEMTEEAIMARATAETEDTGVG